MDQPRLNGRKLCPGLFPRHFVQHFHKVITYFSSVNYESINLGRTKFECCETASRIRLSSLLSDNIFLKETINVKNPMNWCKTECFVASSTKPSHFNLENLQKQKKVLFENRIQFFRHFLTFHYCVTLGSFFFIATENAKYSNYENNTKLVITLKPGLHPKMCFLCVAWHMKCVVHDNGKWKTPGSL